MTLQKKVAYNGTLQKTAFLVTPRKIYNASSSSSSSSPSSSSASELLLLKAEEGN